MSKQKRIAILTLPLDVNYGGILQAYAMQTYLKKNGFEAFHIKFCYWRFISLIRAFFLVVRDLVKCGRICIDHLKNLNRQKTPQRELKTADFVRKYIHSVELPKLQKKVWYKKHGFSSFIVGSDQVWRPEYQGGDVYRYYLDFVNGKSEKKISYAASFGVDSLDINSQMTGEISRCLRQFDAISVREKSGIDICQLQFGVEAEYMIDPTMLLTPDDYMILCEKEKTEPSEGNLLVYVLDSRPEIDAIVSAACAERGFIPTFANKNETDEVYPSVTRWIRGFYDAEFVITDSFHGCVFAILFNKPFVVIGNRQRGLARFESLLGEFGLLDRLIFIEDEYHLTHLNSAIDWTVVNLILAKNRDRAATYLLNNLL